MSSTQAAFGQGREFDSRTGRTLGGAVVGDPWDRVSRLLYKTHVFYDAACIHAMFLL